MKITILPALVAACALTLTPTAFAQRGHGGRGPAPKPSTHVPAGATVTHGGQAHGAQTHGATAHRTTVKPPKPATGGKSVHSTTTKTRSAPAAKGASVKPAKTKTTTKTRMATTTTATTATGVELTPVQQKLQKNTNLALKLQSRLPAGMTVQEACLGFRNLGQFVAAVNVSNNLGIPFVQLKAKMTGDNAMSLGQAIHALRPALDADVESRTALRQADALVAGSR